MYILGAIPLICYGTNMQPLGTKVGTLKC